MRGYKIKWHMYRYAPESFCCSINGKRLYLENPSDFGMMVIQGKRKELNDEIIRIIRRSRKQRKRVGFGFFIKDTNRYCYTSQLGAYDDDLDDKLRIYKEFKEYCLSRDCDLGTHLIESGFFSFGEVKVTVKDESHDIVDLSRPMKFYYKYKELVL